MNREQKVLEKTYRDLLTVKRKVHAVDEVTRESIRKEIIVYRDKKCALSSSGSGTPETDSQNNRNTESSSYVVFANPGIFMKTGDVVEVTTEAGQHYIGTSGRSMGYISHTETPVLVERIV